MGIRTLFLLSFITLFSSVGLAQPADVGGVTLNGDNVSRDYETRTVTIEGNVKIEIGDQTLSCDKASVNLQKNEVLAIGNVLLTSPTTSIQASKMQYNYKTRTGLIEDGFVQAGQVVFEGKKVERTGENTYIAKGARYTSCTTCPAAWSFSGSEIDAEVGGYAYIKYPVLRIADFPVFILPRILIPLKTERQSGILVPSLEFSSRGGAAVSQSFFWAIDQSQDATVTFTHYEKRGLKTHLEYRYMLNEESFGTLQMAYLKDRAFTESGRSNSFESTLHRSFVHYKHYYEMPNNMIQRADLNLVSDLRYPRDFTDELEGHGNPALENKVSLTNNTETQHRSIEAAYYINLLEADSQASNDRSVHRFPEINYNIALQEVASTGLYWQLDFNYVNFSRRDFSYDDTTAAAGSGAGRVVKDKNDGEYDPRDDIIRTGHRMIVAPTINYPFRIGGLFDVVPSVTYNETQYRFNATPDVATCPDNTDCGQNAVRRYLQTDLAVRTKTSLVFGKEDGLSNRYKHEFIPEVIYSTIPWIERPDHVFFGDFEDQPYSRRQEQVTNDDFFGTSKLQFDYKDRLFDKRLATLVLTNNVIRKKNTGDVASYNKLVTFRLKQSYDFNERGADDPQPWSPINALVDIRGDRFENHTVADFYVYGKVTNWSTRLRYNTTLRNFVELTYTRERFVDEKANVSSSSKEIENYGIGTGFKLKYFNFAGRANYSRVTHVFEGWEYLATFKPPGDCWTIDFKQAETVGYDLTTKLNVNFEFGGTI
jgi:LPS-assembly protein